MRKFLAAFLMLVLFAGHALALTGSASALVLQGMPLAAASKGDAAATPAHERVCWRKALHVTGEALPSPTSPCGSEVKNICETGPQAWPDLVRTCAEPRLTPVAAAARAGPFRPPIA